MSVPNIMDTIQRFFYKNPYSSNTPEAQKKYETNKKKVDDDVFNAYTLAKDLEEMIFTNTTDAGTQFQEDFYDGSRPVYPKGMFTTQEPYDLKKYQERIDLDEIGDYDYDKKIKYKNISIAYINKVRDFLVPTRNFYRRQATDFYFSDIEPKTFKEFQELYKSYLFYSTAFKSGVNVPF